MDNIWKQPARLCRRREPPAADVADGSVRRIDSGSLEDMIRRMVARVAEAGATERHVLFIELGEHVLAWSEIRKLWRSPNFPVEI